MNHHTNIFKHLLFKLAPLSVATLLTTTAYADCPGPGTLNNYIRDGALVPDAPDTDWKLRTAFPLSKFIGANFQLVSIEAEKLFNHEYDQRVKRVSCEYKDPNRQENLFLDIETRGKLNTMSVTYNNYDTNVSYVLNHGAIRGYWGEDWKPTANPLIYKCAVSSSDQKKECGGFDFKDHLQGEQRNWYWQDAANWCRGWVKCTGYWGKNYIFEMALLHNDPVGKSYFQYRWSWGALPKKPYCWEPRCKAEIAAMNKIVGGEFGGDEGLAKYLNMCWKNLDWRNKKVTDGQGCSQPTTPWPDYSALEPLTS